MPGTFTCCHCGTIVPCNPRLKKSQKSCSTVFCQQARKKAWGRKEYRTNKTQRKKRLESQKACYAKRPGHAYQAAYRKKHWLTGLSERIQGLEYCVDFGLANRKLMMQRMVDALKAVVGEISTDEIINESHNFAAWENHFNQNVLVHRKGATRAYEGELGMIPGSQGTKSYIVRGLGNPESFKSCSHGAGRKMGIKQAQKELDLEKEVAKLNKQGVIHAIRHKSDLDEAPGAYKDIHEVMENQKDLAEIVVELTPLAVMKG